MIPSFEGNGLLPAGEHACTLAEARAAMCFNPHREALFGNFERFLQERVVPLALRCPIFVDGCFVRTKAFPEDIDIVIDATDLKDNDKLCKLLVMRFAAQHIKQEYHVNFWLKYPDVPNDLVAFFQYVGAKAAAELHVKATHPKGILRIDL